MYSTKNNEVFMDLYEEIAKLAYEMFEREGRVHGKHLDHWFEAEKIIISRYKVQEVEVEHKQEENSEAVAPKKKKPSVRKAKEATEGEAKTKKPTAKKTETTKKRTKKV